MESRPQAPVAPAARERVINLLTHHFANDAITEGDLDDRLHRVYQATTVAELDAIVADLPALAPAGEVPARRVIERVGDRITALLSAQERKIMGVVPRRLEVTARLGYVELDLTHASFGSGLTVIDIRALLGYVQIRFPAGVRVESHGAALLGFFSLKGDLGDMHDATRVVRITGSVTLGFAECFTRERL